MYLTRSSSIVHERENDIEKKRERERYCLILYMLSQFLTVIFHYFFLNFTPDLAVYHIQLNCRCATREHILHTRENGF